MNTTDTARPTCDMRADCTEPVTHVGSDGYAYCSGHAVDRRQGGGERTRRARAWELRWMAEGRALPSYTPGPEPVAAAAEEVAAYVDAAPVEAENWGGVLFEVDGVEYRAEIAADAAGRDAVPFRAPDGRTVYVLAPERTDLAAIAAAPAEVIASYADGSGHYVITRTADGRHLVTEIRNAEGEAVERYAHELRRTPEYDDHDDRADAMLADRFGSTPDLGTGFEGADGVAWIDGAAYTMDYLGTLPAGVAR